VGGRAQPWKPWVGAGSRAIPLLPPVGGSEAPLPWPAMETTHPPWLHAPKGGEEHPGWLEAGPARLRPRIKRHRAQGVGAPSPPTELVARKPPSHGNHPHPLMGRTQETSKPPREAGAPARAAPNKPQRQSLQGARSLSPSPGAPLPPLPTCKPSCRTNNQTIQTLLPLIAQSLVALGQKEPQPSGCQGLREIPCSERGNPEVSREPGSPKVTRKSQSNQEARGACK